MPHRRKSHEPRAFAHPALAVLLVTATMSVGCGRQAPQAPPAAPEVAVVSVAPQAIVVTTELPGRVTAYRTAEIRPQVSGVLLKRMYVEGAVVRAGQTLYQIDPASYRAALHNAQATLARVEAQLPALRLRAERVQSLLSDRAVSRQDMDDAAAALQQAEAEASAWKAAVAASKLDLARCRVTAPVSGCIGRSNVTEGALVTAHQPMPLSTIQQIDSVYVDITQSTSEVLKLRHRLNSGQLRQGGADVSLILEDASRYELEGTLRFREVVTDPTTGSVTLRAAFPNPDFALLPGMFVRALIQEGRNEQAILIPQQGVSRTPKGEPMVLIVGQDGIVQLRMIVLDRAMGNRWLVASGVQAGELVVVEGSQRARPGTVVKSVPFTDEQASPVGTPATSTHPPTAN